MFWSTNTLSNIVKFGNVRFQTLFWNTARWWTSVAAQNNMRGMLRREPPL
jgi:hypothetical protein